MSIACMMKKKRSKTLIADRERTKIVERCDKKEPMNFVDLSDSFDDRLHLIYLNYNHYANKNKRTLKRRIIPFPIIILYHE